MLTLVLKTAQTLPLAQRLSPVRMPWRSAVLDAIYRVVGQTGSAVFTRQHLIENHLDEMVHQTLSTGVTPASTMDRVLQELVLEGKIERVVDGVYRFHPTIVLKGFVTRTARGSWLGGWIRCGVSGESFSVVFVSMHVIYVLAFLIFTYVVASRLYVHLTA